MLSIMRVRLPPVAPFYEVSMTRKECEHILKVLNKITNPDGNVIKAKAYIEKQLKIYDACRGLIEDKYITSLDW